MPETEQNAETSWIEDTEVFIAEASALGDLYKPQLRNLRALARALDDAGEYDKSLAAEYSRIHRWLINKLGGGRAGSASMTEEETLFDMLDKNPGALWSADA